MGKELSEMTLDELWELFPIFLIKPDEKWIGYYEEDAYTDAKTGFISKWTAEARKLYGDRY